METNETDMEVDPSETLEQFRENSRKRATTGPENRRIYPEETEAEEVAKHYTKNSVAVRRAYDIVAADSDDEIYAHVETILDDGLYAEVCARGLVYSEYLEKKLWEAGTREEVLVSENLRLRGDFLDAAGVEADEFAETRSKGGPDWAKLNSRLGVAQSKLKELEEDGTPT